MFEIKHGLPVPEPKQGRKIALVYKDLYETIDKTVKGDSIELNHRLRSTAYSYCRKINKKHCLRMMEPKKVTLFILE